MLQSARSVSTGDYRFGYQGQEQDNKMGGLGQHTTAQFWEYDMWAVKRWNVDPVTYPWQSTYATFNNDPIRYSDPLGLYGSERKARKMAKRAEKAGWQVNRIYERTKIEKGKEVGTGDWGFSAMDARYYTEGFHSFDTKHFAESPSSRQGAITQWNPTLAQALGMSDNWFDKMLYSWADAPVVVGSSLLGSPRHLDGQSATPTERINAFGDLALNVVLSEVGGAGTAKTGLGIVDDVVSSGHSLPTVSLNPTHYITRSRNKMQELLDDIRINGIQEPLVYVEENGRRYIVDGNHRYYAARKLGIPSVPTKPTSLPYGNYKTLMDLIPEGKQPGFWKYLK